MKKIVFLLIIVSLFSCTGKKTENLVSQIYETEGSGVENDKRIKELTLEIKKLNKDLEATLNKYEKVGNFHRALGIKMMHYKMYLKAYEHFSKAIEFFPNSEMLHYYKGVAAGQYALSQDSEVIKREYLEKAKYSQEYAIQLNPRFTKGLYALSILYVYEFDRIDDAKPLLDTLLQISTREFDAMLLRALLYERDGELNAALDMYDSVLSMSKNDIHIIKAETNREKILSRISDE
ncbi:MAG: hypothetical protein JXR64_13390 [Spirochaetales bacterium]|nr:hypothetical protein [Spirochaetales bacterium]